MASKRKPAPAPKPQAPPSAPRAPAAPPVGAAAGLLIRKHSRIVLAALVIVHVLLALLEFEPAPHTGGDNAAYLTLAKSLTERHEYRDLYDPAEPLHTKYPPVFPAILAIALGLGLTSWVKLKLLIVAFSAAGVAFSYLWIKRHGRPELAFGVAGILAVAPGVLEQSHWVLSDVPFWAITMMALFAWQHIRPGARGRFAVAVLLTILAYFTRSAGLPLVVAAFAWLALRRRWRELAVFAAIIIPLALLWWLRARHATGGVQYVGEFWLINAYDPSLGRIGVWDLVQRIRDNTSNYLGHHLPILLFGAPGMQALSLSIVLFGVYGWLRRVRHPGIGELFTPLYIGLILLWPAMWSGERFLLPVLPLILFYAGDAVVRLTRMASRTMARVPAAAAALVIVALGVPANARAVEWGRTCTRLYRLGERYACLPEAYKDFYHLAELAPRILPDGAVVLSRKDRSFYVISGSKVQSRQYPLSDDPAVFFQAVRETGARYLVYDVIDPLTQNYVAPVMLRKTNAFCIMFGLGDERAVVFGIDPAGGALPDSPEDATFAQCGDEYWRSTQVRDSLFNGLIPMP